MAWTTPVHQSTGFLITSTIYNAQLIDDLAYLHGDAGQIDLQSNISIQNTDLTLGRVTTGLLNIGGVGGAAGVGNVRGGYSSSAPGGPATFTPNAAALLNRVAPINSSGTYTIAAPTNSPSSNSGFFILIIQNNSAGAITLSWDPIYVSASALGPPAAGQGFIMFWVYDPAVPKWVLAAGSYPSAAL